MNRQFTKISLSLTVSCLFFEVGYGLTPCQNGYSYDHKCDPYYNVNLIQAKITRDMSTSRRLATSVKIDTQKESSKKLTQNNYKPEGLTYLETLRQKYSNQFNGNMGLQALIDRSKYLSLKKIDKEDINETSPKVKEESKKELVAKVEKVKESSKKPIDKEKKELVAKKEETKKLKVAKKAEKEKIDSTTKFTLYTVKSGDNLTKIAKKYALKKDEILKLNKLDKNATIKIGQKLKLPNKVKLAKVDKAKKAKLDKNIYYIVKSGDTLSSIAKKLDISIVKLREINRLGRSSKIRVGQKLYLHSNLAKKRKIKQYDIVKNTKFRKVPSLKFKRKIRVIATAYTSHKNQTDSTPFLAAWNNRIRPGMKIIAVSPDLIKKYGLTNGVKVKILGLPGYYVVRDKMNKRLKNHIDIYMGVNKRKALQWGRRRIVLYW